MELTDLENRIRTSGITPATLGHDTPLSAPAARRIACDADLVPMITGTTGEPLDLGRSQRFANRALARRDGGCIFPRCTRPAVWTEVHHGRHWAHGGCTDACNQFLFCEHHHTVIHQHGWHVYLHPTDRVPEMIPPATIDPQRKPVRHQRHTHLHHDEPAQHHTPARNPVGKTGAPRCKGTCQNPIPPT